MRTTINIDDELLAQAQQLSGLTERTQLIREALRALVQRESAPPSGAVGRDSAGTKAGSALPGHLSAYF